jgi:predicted nuclease of predicted toxin-antitoxin system
VKLLVDNQLPAALSQWLVSRGWDCLHVADVGLAEASDQEIWTFACDSGRVVVSKDEDFLFRASRETERAGLIWVRLGNCRTKALLSEFERLWPRIEASLRAGERIIEVR